MRCLTILLACGWFLMLPPEGAKYGFPNESEPLSRWMHYASYDTAKECRDSKLFMIKMVEEARKKLTQKESEAMETRAAQVAFMRCVPSDFVKGNEK